MENDFDRIVHQVAKLDRHSRFLLAERIVRELGEQPEHRKAWGDEAERRADAYDNGEMKAIDAKETFEHVRKMIGK